MPTAFTHIAAGVALGQAADPRWSKWTYWSLAVLCSILPDVDALGLRYGIPYGSFWGHRGFLHSFTFAVIAASLLSLFVRCSWRERCKVALVFVTIVASHDVLDGFTNGGLGIAFLSPFDLHRYFFPWRPIRVSPIGMGFFSHRGAAVLKSELVTVWGPAILLGVLLRLLSLTKTSEPKTVEPSTN